MNGIETGQSSQSRGDLFFALERAISETDELPAKLHDPRAWASENPGFPFTLVIDQKEAPCYLTAFVNRVIHLLCDLGLAGAPSLRHILPSPGKHEPRPKLWLPTGSFRTYEAGLRLPTDEALKHYVTELQWLKGELLKVRVKLLGIKTSRGINARKTPGSRGRPKDVDINTALRLLRQGVRARKSDYPDPRERWEWVFEHDVCPHFEKHVWPRKHEGWTGAPEQRIKAVRNLRNALRNRGGIGKPPLKKIGAINGG